MPVESFSIGHSHRNSWSRSGGFLWNFQIFQYQFCTRTHLKNLIPTPDDVNVSFWNRVGLWKIPNQHLKTVWVKGDSGRLKGNIKRILLARRKNHSTQAPDATSEAESAKCG